MKKISRIVIVVVLMLSVLATAIALGLNKKDTLAPGDTPLHTSGFSLSDEELALCTGESYLCGAFFDGERLTDVRWSSSNPSVASVASDGMMTAHTVGETQIKAVYSENMIAEARLWVYSDPTDASAQAILSLADNGSDESFVTLATLARQLGCAKNHAVKYEADLLGGLVRFSEMGAGGSGSPDEAWQQIETALSHTEIQGLDSDTLHRAAIAAYCQGEKLANDVTISFTGDCTFAYFNETDSAHMFPAVYRQSGSVTYPLDLTKNVFGADDITMINFEGTLTESHAHKDKTFYFRGEPAYVNILTQSSIEAVTVENNHSYDYFDQGYNETLSYLRDAKIRYTTFHSPAIIGVGDYHVVMLSLSLVSSSYKPEFRSAIEDYIHYYRGDKTIIIVNLHWGIEGSGTPEAWQVEAAHSMIDAGADMVIGHHPHVLQGIERYNGHYIVYSLGNFSFGGNSSANSPSTIIFRASFTDDVSGVRNTRVSVVPCYTTSSGSTKNNFKPTPLYGDDGEKVINRLLTLSGKLDNGIQSMVWHHIPS